MTMVMLLGSTLWILGTTHLNWDDRLYVSPRGALLIVTSWVVGMLAIAHSDMEPKRLDVGHRPSAVGVKRFTNLVMDAEKCSTLERDGNGPL
jgi:hypothetical protein